MCKNTNFECIKTTIKIFIFILLLNLLASVLGIEYSPFYWLSNFTYDSLPLVQNDVITNSITDKWAIRGQIGDIMSGHFSALAFLAVALSIVYQIEANKQMRESIEKQENALKQNEIAIQQTKKSIEQQTQANLEQAKSTLQQAKAIELQAKSISQQNEALKLQSISLEAQIKELQEARIESSKQTEEFFIQNMNVKLDRYYKLLEDSISEIKDTPKWYHDTRIAIKEKPSLAYSYSSINFNEIKENFDKIAKITDFIYTEILNTKAKSEPAYTIFNEELKIRLNSNSLFSELKEYYKPFKNKDISKLID
ncbi:hypothetical protein ACOTV5_06825 [Aliarcobacter butzleri]|uniref:hypothetical protein n=1 Tax=Aliarcobacter butzleri TaxID=28197 RepID=UPI003AFA880A